MTQQLILENGNLGPCDIPVQLNSRFTGAAAEGYRFLHHLEYPLQTETIVQWIEDHISGSNIFSYEIGWKFTIALSYENWNVRRNYSLGHGCWLVRFKESNNFYVLNQEGFDHALIETDKWKSEDSLRPENGVLL